MLRTTRIKCATHTQTHILNPPVIDIRNIDYNTADTHIHTHEVSECEARLYVNISNTRKNRESMEHQVEVYLCTLRIV